MDMRPQDARAMRATIERDLGTATARVGWSTKPPRPRKSAGTDEDLAKRAAANHLRWTQRHPKAAAAERQLRKARAGMLKRWDHKNDGTPETHEHASRCNQGALARLYLEGGIDREQLAAAVEIAAVAERIGADVAVRTASLETRVDVTRLGDGTFYERLSQVRREVAYTRWRSALTPALRLRPGQVAAVLDMLIGEPVGFTVIAKRYRMHNRRARRLLIEALDLWARTLGAVCKEIDQATLTAAQAGIL
jgi:hypothetical protein